MPQDGARQEGVRLSAANAPVPGSLRAADRCGQLRPLRDGLPAGDGVRERGVRER